MTTNSPAEASPHPTRVRYLVVLITLLMSLLLYLDRFCISFASQLIKEDLGLTNTQVSWILGAFFASYALGQVPTGWLSDRFGPRAMLTLYILAWSLFTALTGLAAGFFLLLALRLGFGLAQAGAYPTAAGLLRNWVPFSSRGIASGWVASGGRIGGALAPTLTGYLIVLFVPISTASKFREHDLLDFPRLCYLLHDAQAAGKFVPVSETVVSRLPQEAQQIVALRGQQYAKALELHKQNKSDEPLAAVLPQFLDPPIRGEEKTRLVLGLNVILTQRNLYSSDMFPTALLPDQARRLIRIPSDDWQEEEVERLNRLLLELAYPQDLKKLYVLGWRPVLVVYGLAGLLVAAMFWYLFRNRPSEHPWCNSGEVELIAGGASAPSSARAPVGGIPLKRLLLSRTMCLTSISQVGTNIGWVFLVTLLPRYLEEVHRMPIEIRSWMAGVPLWVGWLGMLCGGVLTDRMVRLFGLRWGRALPMGLTRFLAMAAFLVCLLPLSAWFGERATPWLLIGAFATVAFATDLGVPAVWAFCQDVGGRHVGSVLGWGNMWGNFGAALSPILLTALVDEASMNWNLAFAVCAVSFLISGLAALGIDATRPIVPEDSLVA